MSKPNQKELLAQYNKLAEKAGKPKLTKVEPAEKLQARIARMKAADKPKKSMTLKEHAEKKPEPDADLITVVDVANAMNMDPKVARAKLRRAGQKANEGRWPSFKRGSTEHNKFIAMLSPNTKKALARKAEQNAKA